MKKKCFKNVINFMKENDLNGLTSNIKNNEDVIKDILEEKLFYLQDILIYSIYNNSFDDLIKGIIELYEELELCECGDLDYYITYKEFNITPLFFAIANNRFKIADVLIEKGCSIDSIIDNLHRGLDSIKPISLDILEFLIEIDELNENNLDYILNMVKFFPKDKNKENLFNNKINEIINNKSLNDKVLEIFIEKYISPNSEKMSFLEKDYQKMYEEALKWDNYKALVVLFSNDYRGIAKEDIICELLKDFPDYKEIICKLY